MLYRQVNALNDLYISKKKKKPYTIRIWNLDIRGSFFKTLS